MHNKFKVNLGYKHKKEKLLPFLGNSVPKRRQRPAQKLRIVEIAWDWINSSHLKDQTNVGDKGGGSQCERSVHRLK